MKKLTLVFLFLFAVIIVSAQKKQNVYLLKNNGKEVKIRDSADYVRIIEEPDSGETNYNIQEFYIDGGKKLIGKVSSFEKGIIYEGTVIRYYKNGMKKSAINYKKDVSVGMAYYFFENGKLKKQVEFLEKDPSEKKDVNLAFEERSKLIYQVDSMGKVLVKDGNGHLIDTTKSAKDQFVEEGDYKDGFKDGVWKGHYVSGKSNYVESYALGKFISGVNTEGDKTYEYTILESRPQYKGGINAFYKYLGNAIRYPSSAYKSGISGSVHVSFTIEKDGKVSDVTVVKSVFGPIDEEALRVVNASPKWIPGMQRGLPVKVKYNIPISFKLR